MLIRIPLTAQNVSITHVYNEDNNSGASTSADKYPQSDPKIIASFSLEPIRLSSLPDYNHSRYTHPATTVRVTVPDSDLPVVASWLGSASAIAGSASDTFIKRMTAAVTDALERYYTATERARMFTRPFRIGAALRLTDGSLAAATEPVLMRPASMAPSLVVREGALNGSIMTTLTEIINSPVFLKAKISPLAIDEKIVDSFDSLIIYATRQCSMLRGDETVSGIRTASVFGEHVPCWSYNRLAEDLVIQKALADSSFRIIREIPVADAMMGLENLELPLPATDLSDWSSFESLPANAASDSNGLPERIIIETEPFDLNYPENLKRIKGVSLRGIFDKKGESDGVKFALYGSLHRDTWHQIATARGAFMRLLHGIRYRWYKLRIEAPYSSRFDAVTFDCCL